VAAPGEAAAPVAAAETPAIPTVAETPATPAAVIPEVAPVAAPGEVAASSDRPFVGRLDELVDSLPGPVQKQQLINQVKKNLREYDVQRLEEALANVPANAKLTPAQLKEALGKTYSPQQWRSEDLPVKANAYFGSKDNIFDKPMGVSNLYIATSPETKELAIAIKADEDNLRTLRGGAEFADAAEKFKQTMQTNPAIKNDPAAQSLLSKINFYQKEMQQISDKEKEIKNITYGFIAPSLYKNSQGIAMNHTLVTELFNAMDKSMPYEQRYQAASNGALKQILNDATTKLVSLGADPNSIPNVAGEYFAHVQASAGENLKPQSLYEFIRSNPELKAKLDNVIDPIAKPLAERRVEIQRDINPEVRQVEDALKSNAPYTGDPIHHSVYSPDHTIGFSRFTEHEATIPGEGTVPGRHFHELQSDLAQDVRKKGAPGGSMEKDKAELAALRQKVGEMRAQVPTKNPEQHQVEIAKLDNRLATLTRRIGQYGKKPTYNVQQPFAGFETNPAVEQQLLMKNAIQSTMKGGGRFATFPGAESERPLLYEKKVPNNLKQVVKDLGGKDAGFTIQDIQLQKPDGSPVKVHGVSWTPEAAARILKEGVKFRHGGSVERQSDDNRRYL
jgi:cell fate (sporulation/competence/biofilm development) regulator YlbF (YheA/YmcA/DUF963 family)